MQARPIDTDDPRAASRPAQLAALRMLILMCVLALTVLALYSGSGWQVAVMIVLWAVTVPLALTVTFVYGEGYLRTFCIGALFPAGAAGFFFARLFSVAMIMSGGEGMDRLDADHRLGIGIYLFVACIVIVSFGLLAMGVRWLVEEAQRQPSGRAPGHSAPPAFGQNRETV
ncbi:MAG: hypothetical protein ACYTG0_16675 [Planctomycetota bacterium]|jgi:hypothetical protein